MQPKTFIFDSYAFDAASGVLHLNYAFDNGAAFTEKLQFPKVAALDAASTTALDRIFKLLFLLAGVSYYKAYIPEKLVCKAFPLDAATARWLEKVYTDGLGEFSYRNNVTLNVNFEDAGVRNETPVALKLSDKLLVPVGGGKDSIVTIEALKAAGHSIIAFALGGTSGPAQPIADTIRISGLPSTEVARTIAPSLIDLNKTGVYNGHVPITAILSVIALACAVMQGFKAVVMSNEHSASSGNFEWQGRDINHQYSKSFAFERDLANWVATNVSPDLGYFSLLRPLGEIDITRRFAKHDAYFNVFRSCNTAFKQNVSDRGTQWCCNCPKCRFVFLALAPFIDKAKLTTIFGTNMLDDASQTDGFAALCGIDADKPFECVGEVWESASVLKELSKRTDWQNDHIVKSLSPKLTDSDFEKLFVMYDDHAVPPLYMKALAS